MLARVAKEREGHRASRRKCKCVLLLLVCEWLVAQNRPRGKEERTIWAEPQNGTAFRYSSAPHSHQSRLCFQLPSVLLHTVK
jgi:hypothetical protein